mgnify:CR=1 FL=1
MRIYFSNVNFSSNSGPNTFAGRLANQLGKMGHNIIESNKDYYDVFLCFIEPDCKPLETARFIHRLDGIWFKPEQFKTHNKGIKGAYNIADHVVWQSEFDKKMTSYHWGKRTGTVIHNGIELDYNQDKIKYTNIQDLRSRIKGRIFVSSASWHRQKRLKENIEFFLKNRENEDVMIVLGKNPDVLIQENLKNIIFFTGDISHFECLEIYKNSDWMIHLAWLDHCPNVVVEAISMGCPVICTDSGGTKEIVRNNGIIIPETTKYNYELTDYDNPYEINIKKIDLIKPKINRDYLDIKTVALKYNKIMGSL